MSKNILSVNAIEEYVNYNSKSSISVDNLLQVLEYTEIPLSFNKDHNSTYIVSLSDSLNYYKDFLLPKKDVLRLFDIVRIKEILHIPKGNKNFGPRILINNYQIVEHLKDLIGSPTLIFSSNKENNLENQLNSANTQVRNFNCNNGNNNKQFNNNSNSNNYNTQINSNINYNNFNKNTNNINNYQSSNNYDPPSMYSNKNIIEKPKNKFYTPLNSLNTLARDIKLLVRVIDKGDLRPFTNEKGVGHLFNFSILDQEGAEMSVTCFNKTAAKFFDIVKEGSVYEINGGYVKMNNRKFNSTKADYQLILNDSATVNEVKDEGTITNMNVNIKKLCELKHLPLHSIIDTVGYVTEVGDQHVVSTKNGELQLKKIYIVDDSEYKVEFTLWKKNSNINIEIGDIILVRNGAVSEFNGRNISATDNTKIVINPRTLKEANSLAKWITNFEGSFKTYAIVKEKKESNADNNTREEIDKSKISRIDNIIEQLILKRTPYKDECSSFNTIKAVVTYFQHSEKNFYPGCPVKKCKKKLVEEENSYYCCTCNSSVKVPAYYMTLNIKIKDCLSEYWIDFFGATAEKFIGMSVENYKEIVLKNNKAKMDEISKNIEFKSFYFVIRAKLISFNNILKRKINVYKSEAVNIGQEFLRIYNEILGIEHCEESMTKESSINNNQEKKVNTEPDYNNTNEINNSTDNNANINYDKDLSLEKHLIPINSNGNSSSKKISEEIIIVKDNDSIKVENKVIQEANNLLTNN